MTKKVISSLSQLAEKLVYLDGNPYSLADYPHQRTIIDSPSKRIVMKFSRQTAKSTTLAILTVMMSITRKSFRTLYVAPRIDQTKLFSNDRIDPMLMQSPKIKKNFIDPRHTQNVFRKQFNNGSKVYLRYALLSGNALRGYSTDMIMYDETQDLLEEVIAVANETMNRSLYKKEVYAGTPKGSQGTLAKYWFNSTRNEWAVKCTPCGHWNVPLNETNVAEWGLCCAKCGKELEPKTGIWVCTGDPNALSTGFRVSALQFYKAPWVNWKKDIIEKRKLIGEALWFNEVLGIEYDSGVSPLTMEDMRKACVPSQPLSYDLINPQIRTIGIDYGPINSEKSFTYLAMGYWKSPDVYQFIYFKRFDGVEANPSVYHQKIAEIFHKSGASLIGADYGMGEASNSEIRKRIGYNKLIAYFASDSQKEPTSYNAKMPGYTFSKSKIFTQFIQKIKDRKILFPSWEGTENVPGMAAHAQDFLNVSIDIDEDRNKQKYTKVGTDDAFQAAVMCYLAAQIAKNVY